MIQTHLYIPTNLNPNNNNHDSIKNPQDDIIPLCLKKLHDEEKSNNGHYHASCTGTSTTSSNTTTSSTTTAAVPFSSSSCRCDLQEYVSDEHYRILSQNATAALESCHCVEVYNPTTMIPCQQQQQQEKKEGKEGDHRPPPPRPAAPVIYVHQRELAHASSQQYNNNDNSSNGDDSMGGAVLASDSATTCHIVAFQSVVQLYLEDDEEKKNNNVLGTLCHFDSMEDGTIWTCLKDILQHHVQYHHCTNENNYNTRQEGTTTCTRNDDDDNDDDDGDSTCCCFEKKILQLDVHMIGGYDDDQNTSNAITYEIISSLVKLAFQWRDIVKMTLKTCIVGRLNNNKNTQVSSMLPSAIQDDDCRTTGSSSSSSSSSSTAGVSSAIPLCVSSPILRGLAMNVALGGGGRVYLLKHHVDKSFVGPEPILRHVRLWSSAPEAKEMITVHDYDQERIVLRPFTFYAFHGVERLMTLPDGVLLQCTSTSPECESEDFCDGIRKVCRYLMQTRVEDVFGPENCRKSLIFKYSKCKEKEGQEGERTVWVWEKDHVIM